VAARAGTQRASLEDVVDPIAAAEPRSRSTLVLVLAIVLCEFVGAAGALIVDRSFYDDLARPSWAPPASLFGPLWTILYTVMGIAAWLVWRTGTGRRPALTWFAIQLVLNAAWTPIFFGLHSITGGLVVIVLLDAAIVATIIAFARRSRIAAALLVPYAVWVGYATVLNAAIWNANR
jgi:tryptophan-rich sensory protein